MSNQDQGHYRDRIRRFFLGLDSTIDDRVYTLGAVLRRTWGRMVGWSQDLRVRGFSKLLVEILDEGLTWGALGAVIMLALAQPSMKATRSDWRARADLAVTFEDRTGVEIGKRGVMQTDASSLDDLPDYLPKAAMAIEDRRFYQHFGIDVIGTFRAMVQNARAHTVVQGGSSITQQLAKNLFLSNERTLDRKIREAFLALWLESHFTKDQILKLYLDRAYLGGGVFGVEAAAQFYFGKPAHDLTLAESAMIAGLFKAPSKFAPHVNLPAARARANVVLDAMVAAGFMTEGQVHAARLNPATPVDRQRSTSPDYYLDWAFGEVKALADEGKFGDARSLVVRTALDPALQARAESSIENTLRQYGQQYGVKQASMALIEPQGAVRAMVGGRDYGASQFNRASEALRQPGSSFKVYVYTTAMLNGYTPTSVVLDGPITIGTWSPHNYSNRYHGKVQLITALTHSYNTVPVRLGRAVGLDKVIDTAVRMGVRTPLRLNRALALGTSEVTILDQATGYNTLANGGYRTVPYAVLDVRDSQGTILWRHDRDGKQPERVLAPQIVAEMNQMLVNVVENGTGRRAQIPGIRVGGKTGTSQDYRDGWFIGFTGDFTCAVWFGNDDYTGTKKMTGGTLPAMVWHDVMTLAESGVDPKPIPGVAPATGGAARVAERTGPPTGEPAGDRLSRRAVSVLNDIEAMMRRAAGESLTEAAPAGDDPSASPASFRKQARTGPDNSAGDPAVAVR